MTTAVHQAPDLHERLEGYRPGPSRPHNQANVRAKTSYLADLLGSAGSGLRAAGLGPVYPYGHSRRIQLPPGLPVAAYCEVRLMASQSYTRLTLVTLAPSGNPQESEALLEMLRRRYADVLATGAGTPLRAMSPSKPSPVSRSRGGAES